MKRKVPVISSYNGGLGTILEGYRYLYNPYIDNDFEKAYELFKTDTSETIEYWQHFLSNRVQEYSADKMYANYIALWNSL